MAPCTHPGVKRLFCLITSREVNEARGVLILAAGRVRSKKKKNREQKIKKKFAPSKTHHEIHSSPATATTSRRRSKKHVPHVSPYSPASIDTGFVEIDLVQLSQSVKTTNVTHTLTDTHIPTDISLIKILKNLSCEYDRWVVETQLCKLRGT